MEAIRFKDRGCEQCKVEMRKQIIQEIHEAVGCLTCDRLYHHESKNPNIKPLTKVKGRHKDKRVIKL